MLDIKLIRENPDFVRDGLATRNSPVDIAEVLALDERRRAAITEADQLKNTRNDVSRQIGVLKKAGQDTSEIQRQTREIGEKIAALDNAVREIEAQQEKLMLAIPNLPHASVPRGRDAADTPPARRVRAPAAQSARRSARSGPEFAPR